MEETQTTTLKLASYNVFLLPGFTSYFIKIKHYQTLRQKLISERIIPKYDIICLQELFTTLSPHQRRIISSAAQSGLTYSAAPPNRTFCSLRLTNSGLLTLSRHKIIRRDFRRFKSASGADAMTEKGILYTKIKLPNGILHLFNTHLQATYGDVYPIEDGTYPQLKNLKCRFDQCLELREYVTETLNEWSSEYNELKRGLIKEFNDTVIVLGDFNIKSSRYLPKSYFQFENHEKAQNWLDNQPDNKFNEFGFLKAAMEDFGQEVVRDFVGDSFGGRHPESSVGGLGDCNTDPKTEEGYAAWIEQAPGDGIDFIFEIFPGKKCKGPLLAKNEGKNVKYVPFEINHEKFGRLSDHFVIHSEFEFRERIKKIDEGIEEIESKIDVKDVKDNNSEENEVDLENDDDKKLERRLLE